MWQICGSECATVCLACCDHSLPRSPARASQAHSTTTGSLSSPAEVPKLPFGVAVLVLVLDLDSFVSSLVLAMIFAPSDPVRALPATAATWSRVAVATRDGHHEAWGADVLVNVQSSKLAAALPLMKYVLCNGHLFLPLNVIVYLRGRLGWVEDDRLKIDLASGLSAATLASFEEWTVTDGRLDWSPTSETEFLQHMLTLAAELSAAGELPAALKITAHSFVSCDGHGDSVGGPDWTDSWQSRMKVLSLT